MSRKFFGWIGRRILTRPCLRLPWGSFLAQIMSRKSRKKTSGWELTMYNTRSCLIPIKEEKKILWKFWRFILWRHWLWRRKMMRRYLKIMILIWLWLKWICGKREWLHLLKSFCSLLTLKLKKIVWWLTSSPLYTKSFQSL